jgi:16S rRNA (guanine966-N2)-methyltransferase
MRAGFERAPAARVRGASNPARWGSSAFGTPSTFGETGADFGFLLLTFDFGAGATKSRSPPVRIIAGKFRGRKLVCPKLVTRPTLDRVREALFSILGDLSDANVVDFYAGSGALGFEALSRGARYVTLVEADRQAAKVIHENVEGWGIEAAYRVVECAVEKSRGSLERRVPIDLVLGDPPWKISAEAAVSVPLVIKGLLSPSAIVVLGHASRDALEISDESGLEHYDTRAWGDSALSFFRPSSDREPEPASLSV